ncbi:hypothetical protein TNCV_2948801 [Trichonephila clavipes]|nr:hypothetical protein TNCV_2948801 [Trichonephila clavipes]
MALLSDGLVAFAVDTWRHDRDACGSFVRSQMKEEDSTRLPSVPKASTLSTSPKRSSMRDVVRRSMGGDQSPQLHKHPVFPIGGNQKDRQDWKPEVKDNLCKTDVELLPDTAAQSRES